MTTDNEPEVKDVEKIVLTPSEGDDDIIKPETTDPESSQDEIEGDDEDDSKKPDELVRSKPQPEKSEDIKTDGTNGEDGLADVKGETPKERAMRLEVTRLKGRLRQEQRDDLLGDQPPVQTAKKEVSPERAAILAKYKPEEISSLREVLPALAEEMGFVRKDELQGSTFAERAQDHLDNFLEKHPEYNPENDKDGTLWNAFKSEYTLYKTPSNPKDFPKIFDRIHRDVFGIKPAGTLKTVNAQVEKVKTASHAGSSASRSAPSKPSKVAPQGLRTDMLIGFEDDEIADMTG